MTLLRFPTLGETPLSPSEASLLSPTFFRDPESIDYGKAYEKDTIDKTNWEILPAMRPEVKLPQKPSVRAVVYRLRGGRNTKITEDEHPRLTKGGAIEKMAAGLCDLGSRGGEIEKASKGENL